MMRAFVIFLFSAVSALAQTEASMRAGHAVRGYSSDTHAHDVSGLGSVGVSTNATTTGAIYTFSNSASINFGRTDALHGATAATWTFWIYPQNSQTLHAVDTVYGNATTNRGYFMGLASMKPRLLVYGPTNSSIYSEADANTALPVNTWRHVAMTWPTRKIYVDGAEVSITLSSNGIPPVSISLHQARTLGRTISQEFGWTGRVHDVRQYARILSSNEIKWIVTQTMPEVLGR